MTFEEAIQSTGTTLGLNNAQTFNSVEKKEVIMTFDEAVNYIAEYLGLEDMTYKSGHNYYFKGNRFNMTLNGSVDNCSLTFNVYNEGLGNFYCAWTEVFSLDRIEDYMEIIESSGVLDANNQTITIYDLLSDLDDDISIFGSVSEDFLGINNSSNNANNSNNSYSNMENMLK